MPDPRLINSFHHYVPEFLLNYFATGNQVFVADKDQKIIRSQTTSRSAGQRGFNTMSKDGKLTASLESMHEKVETIAAPIVQRLNGGQTSLSEQEKSDMAAFLVLLYLRVPSMHDRMEEFSSQFTKLMMATEMQDDHTFEEAMSAAEKRTGQTLSDDKKDEIRQDFLDGNYELYLPRESKHLLSMKTFEGFYRLFRTRAWQILSVASDQELVTSDCPVYTYNNKQGTFSGEGVGILATDCETIAVLTPKIAIQIQQEKAPHVCGHSSLSVDETQTINQKTVLGAKQFVFGKQRESLLALTKSVLGCEFSPQADQHNEE